MDKKKISDWSNYFKFLISKKLYKKSFLKHGLPHMKGDVLDVGSGRGPFHKAMGDSVRIISIDYNAKRGPDALGSCLALPFKDASFDSILCTEVLEHVPDPLQALMEIERVMRPGAHVYITAPMLWCLHYEPYDFFRFTKYGLRELVTKSGLKVSGIEPIGSIFSYVFTRFGEFFYNLLNKIFMIFPRTPRFFLVLLVSWPVSMVLYLLALLLGPLAKKDVYSWSVVARKDGR